MTKQEMKGIVSVLSKEDIISFLSCIGLEGAWYEDVILYTVTGVTLCNIFFGSALLQL